MIDRVVSSWPEKARILAARFWPGPLTLVVRKTPDVPGIVTAGLPTVGVRMPAHPVALALIAAAEVPVAAPSANRFAQLSPTTAEHVRQGLGDRVDYILDGRPCEVGIESTVVSLNRGAALFVSAGRYFATTDRGGHWTDRASRACDSESAPFARNASASL